MKVLSSVLLRCTACGRQGSFDNEAAERWLDAPMSINNVGKLYGRLRCSGCGSRDIKISDERGSILIDPQSLKPCRTCGCPIPVPRLAAMPGADRCLDCAVAGTKPQPAPPYPQPPAKKRKCPSCGYPTIVRQRNDDQSFFLGCTGFPKCRWTDEL